MDARIVNTIDIISIAIRVDRESRHLHSSNGIIIVQLILLHRVCAVCDMCISIAFHGSVNLSISISRELCEHM